MGFEDINLIINGKRILRNKLGITDPELLAQAEKDITRTSILIASKLSGDFNFEHLCNINKTIFGDIYEWAGTPREWDIIKRQKILNGESVDYCHFRNIEATIEQKTTSLKRLLMRIL